MRKRILFPLLTLATVVSAGILPRSIHRQGATTIVATDSLKVGVTPVNANVFRVVKSPLGAPLPLSNTQAIMLEGCDTAANTLISFDAVYFTTPTTTVKVDRKTGQVTFFDTAGEVILAEADGPADGKIRFLSGADERYYGAGERGHRLSLNGDTLVMYNRQNYGYTEGDPRISQMNITVPFVASDLGYGVLMDDHVRSRLILGDTITYESENTRPVPYYFINGGSTLAETVQGYTELTGRQELPPFWALGYITSKYGYRTQDETLGVVDTLKRRGYPLDGIVLDLYWYGQETDMGRFEWNKEQWPDHRAMLDSLRREGVNMVIISQPYINKIGAIDRYNELAAKGLLTKNDSGQINDVTTWVGEAGMFDVSNPETRAYLWDLYRDLTLEGVAGWWGDLGEPEVHPETIRHHNGMKASEYHNVYGNDWSSIIYNGFKNDFPDTRLMTLMRGGTAGLQRYSVFPWSTDVSRSWGGLQPQVKIMLNSGLSGLGYMSSDVGGFAVDPASPLDPELYVRWLQMGTFAPILRTHAQLKPEPYNYPEQEKILLDFIRQRYQWLPYNYTLAYENSTYGYPLARPLNFDGENPQDIYSEIPDEYLWGSDVLIAPVMKKGARSRKVTFPAGEWVDWNNPRRTYKGGTTATVPAPLSELPMFVRTGSFIPQYRQPIENVTQYDPTLLTVKYFPSTEDTSYTMFEDDRVSTRSLTDDTYLLITFSGHRTGSEVEIGLAMDGMGYKGMPHQRLITFEVENMAKAPREVLLNGEPLAKKGDGSAENTWSYSAANQRVTLTMPWNYGDDTLTIK